jgi:hypothetical protein
VRSRDPEAKLAERALRERWPVPPDRLPGLVTILLELAESPATRPRERIAATKALLGASKLNLEALKVAMLAEEFDLLRDRLAGLTGGGDAGDPVGDTGNPDVDGNSPAGGRDGPAGDPPRSEVEGVGGRG